MPASAFSRGFLEAQEKDTWKKIILLKGKAQYWHTVLSTMVLWSKWATWPCPTLVRWQTHSIAGRKKCKVAGREHAFRQGEGLGIFVQSHSLQHLCWWPMCHLVKQVCRKDKSASRPESRGKRWSLRQDDAVEVPESCWVLTFQLCNCLSPHFNWVSVICNKDTRLIYIRKEIRKVCSVKLKEEETGFKEKARASWSRRLASKGRQTAVGTVPGAFSRRP